MTHQPPLLSTTYFGPISWYRLLANHDDVWLEACETFQKQTFRNRCLISGPNGIQPLTVPCSASTQSEGYARHAPIRQTAVSNHGRWRQQHWQALQTAYGETPFFVYYSDDIRPFFEEEYSNLWQLNNDILHTMCSLIDISPRIHYTAEYHQSHADKADYRSNIHPKQDIPAGIASRESYYQVFPTATSQLSGLSILDLLFNLGPESILYLRQQ